MLNQINTGIFVYRRETNIYIIPQNIASDVKRKILLHYNCDPHTTKDCFFVKYFYKIKNTKRVCRRETNQSGSHSGRAIIIERRLNKWKYREA